MKLSCERRVIRCASQAQEEHAYAKVTYAAKFYVRSQSRSEFSEELCISIPQYCTMQCPVDYVYLTWPVCKRW